MWPWRQIIFAYVLGFLVYVLVTAILLPAHVLLRHLSPNGHWNDRWKVCSEFVATFCAGALCYFASPDMGYMPDATVAVGLTLTFFFSYARQVAYGAISTGEMVANLAGFSSSIMLLFVIYHSH